MTVTWNMLDKVRAERDLAVAERDAARQEAERRRIVIRNLHAEKALAPGLECHCEFCEPPDGTAHGVEDVE